MSGNPLQRAYSVRTPDSSGMSREDWLRKVLPHVSDDTAGDDVTVSSPRHFQRMLRASLKKGFGEISGNDGIATTSGVPADQAAATEDEGDDGNDDEEAAPQRGLPLQEGDRISVGEVPEKVLLPPRPWEPNVNMSLSEFEEDKVTFLAEGAMCQCFVARSIPASMELPEDLAHGAREEGVVIKTTGESCPETAENDLLIESLVLRELRHHNILQLLGAGHTPAGKGFIVLEYLGGGSLRTRLDNIGGGLGVKPAVKHALQLVSALKYMHDDAVPGMIVMHRDLKPDNIGFTSDGVPKLMDFGLVKVISRRQRCGSVRYKMTGETGSPRYMPPEVAQSEPYNEKADVWSFIVIFWEMMSGRLPFAGMSMEMYLENVCQFGERPLIAQNWPQGIKNVLQDGWQLDPDLRPSFREIHAVLQGLSKDLESAGSGKKWFFGLV